MGVVRLLEVAAEAEALRLRREARRVTVQVVLCSVAGAFALLAVGLLHLAVLVTVARHHGLVTAALWMALVDLMVAGVLIAVSRIRRVDPIALEALRIRRRALEEISTGSVIGGVLRVVGRGHGAHAMGAMLIESLIRSFTRR